MNEQDSLTIKVCRVLCIFFMAYVHVNPGRDFWPADSPQHLHHLGYLLADVLGRASVPALSVLSGYLAVAAYRRRGSWWAYAKDRWTVMIVPMVFWNAMVMLLALVVLFTTGIETSVLHHLGRLEDVTALLLLDRLTGFNYGSATSALSFLRDLFMCSLLLPVILLATRGLDAGAVGLVWLMGLTVGFSPVVMRPHILMFFSAGVYLVVRGPQLIPTLRTLLMLLGAVLLAFVLAYISPFKAAVAEQSLRSTVFRLLMASAFLVATVGLSRVAVGRQIARLEPAIFLMYLSHVVVLLVLWGAWQQFFDKDLAWPYAVFFVTAPVLTLLLVLKLFAWLRMAPTPVQQIVFGKAWA
jgi:succinoglycan biosynthesis protein ExoH